MATMTRQPAASGFDGSLTAGVDDAIWELLELEIAREQLQVLADSMAQGRERMEQLSAELRMLPWNWARSVRDARLALGESRAAIAAVQQQADAARDELHRATNELAAAEAQLATTAPERRSRGLGLLMRRRRRHDGTLLDLRMNHTLAGERLQGALNQLTLARIELDRQRQALDDLLAGRRRQRSILSSEIETLERHLLREQAHYRDCSRIVAEFEARASTAEEDSMVPA